MNNSMTDPDSSDSSESTGNKPNQIAASNTKVVILEKINNFFKKKPRNINELNQALKTAYTHKILSQEALSMIEGVMEVSDLQVRDIMIPRSQVVAVELNSKLEDFLPKLVESGHSRFPVLGDNREEVLGTLLAKDLLPFILKPEQKINLKDLLRPFMLVPESKRVNILLKEFRAQRHHMAIVADEYGGISGLVTIEDILEQIVGDIEDEFDTQENNITKIKENTFQVQALMPIAEFNDFFGTDFSDEDFDTIGGVVLNSFGRLPLRNESIEIAGIKIKILNADKRRIKLLRIVKLN